MGAVPSSPAITSAFLQRIRPNESVSPGIIRVSHATSSIRSRFQAPSESKTFGRSIRNCSGSCSTSSGPVRSRNFLKPDLRDGNTMRSSNSTPNKRKWGEGQDFQEGMIRVSVMRLDGQKSFRLAGGLGLLNQSKTQPCHIKISASARDVLQLSCKFPDDKLEPIRVMRTLRQPGALSRSRCRRHLRRRPIRGAGCVRSRRPSPDGEDVRHRDRLPPRRAADPGHRRLPRRTHRPPTKIKNTENEVDRPRPFQG
jgi:hypothetical protein